MTGPSGKLIKKTKVVNGHVSDIWAKWTTHECLKTFFGPDNRIELWGPVPEEYDKIVDCKTK